MPAQRLFLAMQGDFALLYWPFHKFHILLHQIIDTGGHAGLYPARPNVLALLPAQILGRSSSAG